MQVGLSKIYFRIIKQNLLQTSFGYIIAFISHPSHFVKLNMQKVRILGIQYLFIITLINIIKH